MVLTTKIQGSDFPNPDAISYKKMQKIPSVSFHASSIVQEYMPDLHIPYHYLAQELMYSISEQSSTPV